MYPRGKYGDRKSILPKLVLDVNVGGTENIVDLCLEHPECRKHVYVSPTGAIPELPHGQKIKEVEEVNLDVLEESTMNNNFCVKVIIISNHTKQPS